MYIVFDITLLISEPLISWWNDFTSAYHEGLHVMTSIVDTPQSMTVLL